ncbi:MAG TPA: hypothetical protein VFQ35_21460 [Polyangiaceae bacterium]|nr:hypothetical protein [Polyangiaceae bacterium]
MDEFEAFRRRARSRHTEAHAVALGATFLSLILGAAFDAPLIAFGATGVFAVAAGIYGFRGGVRFGVGFFRGDPSTREWEQMSPTEREAHARKDGATLIAVGLGLLGLAALWAMNRVIR